MRDRRRHPRVSLQVDVDVSTATNFYVGRTRDLSAGGLFVESSERLEPGTEVQLKLRVSGKPLVLDCVVRWGLADEAGAPVGFGVEFVELPAFARRAIEGFMSARDPMDFEELEPEPDEAPGGDHALEPVAAVPRPRKRPPPLPPS